MNNIKLLIFPLDMDDASVVISVAKALNIQVVGASSAMVGPADSGVDCFIRLPYVTDPKFDETLKTALAQNLITHVYSPHQGVWLHLDALLRASPSDVKFDLCRPDPFTATRNYFLPHEDWASAASYSILLEGCVNGSKARPPLARSCYSALHRQFHSIPGQCDQLKLQALCDIARLIPAGDVLEVGSLYGRSAFVLGYLAGRHKLGSLICVDPWNLADCTNQGPQAAIFAVDLVSIDLEMVFQIFLSTAALLDNVGYIRKTSESALSIYESARLKGELHSPELGCIPLTSQLALIHIDGNHRYDHVSRDVEIWSPFLAPGGWLLLDDYVWAFGDGPRRVGDELLNSPLYDSAFVSGDTLFVRRTEVVN